MTKNKGTWLAAAGVVVVGLVGAYVLARPETSVVQEEPSQVAKATDDQLDRAADLRIFFAHQSVGQNMIDAIPDIYSPSGMQGPTVIQSDEPQASPGGFFQHVLVGANGDPVGKIAEFDRIIRSGVGDTVDVAALKLCYVDFSSSTDVDQVFEIYKSTMANLRKDFPNVTFIYVTAPITTDRSLPKRVKVRLGLDDSLSPSDNIAREAFNLKVRAEYSHSGLLFDIAAIQSTAADGMRALKSFDGATYYAMEETLASDPGHLSRNGAVIVGSAFLEKATTASQAHGELDSGS